MNTKMLRKICQMEVTDFAKLGDTTTTPHGPLTHIDNGGQILAVGHLDWVLWSKPTINGSVIRCPQLDDRLGVWTLLELLPSLGCVPFDVLLTDAEEDGNSTAQHFDSPKDYRWIFEFDRAGTDVVLYDYHDKETEALIEQYGFDVGWGSFSDISYMEHLQRKAFNFGVGYHRQHTKGCFANLADTKMMAEDFCTFAADLVDTELPHTPHAPVKDDWADMWCPQCATELEYWFNYCPECGHLLMDVEVLYENGRVQ